MAEIYTEEQRIAFEPWYLPEGRFFEIENFMLRERWPPAPILMFGDSRLDAVQRLVMQHFHTVATGIVNRYGIEETIYVCLLDSSILNAAAVRLPGNVYCVVISAEVVTRIARYGRAWIDTADNSTAIGLPSSEVVINKENYQTFARSFGIPDVAWVHQPVDHFVSTIGVILLIMHELGHIVNGHIATEGSASDIKAEIEEGGSSLNSFNNMALEADADAFAAQNLFNFIHPHITDENILSNVYLNRVLSGCAILYGTFGLGRSYPYGWLEQGKLPSHPPPSIRVRYTLETVRALILRDFPTISTSALDECMSAFFIRAIVAMSYIAGQIVYPDGHAEVEDSDFTQFTHRMNSAWAAIRPQLERQKLGKHSLAPATLQ